MPGISPARSFAERYYDCLFGVYARLLYSRLGKYYDLVFGLFSSPREAHRRVIEGLSHGSILDVACGTGSLLAMASGKGLQCYGIDLSPGMLDRARSRVPDAELRVGNFEDLPYPDNHFDRVVCTNALGSVRVNPRTVLSEIVRVCKYGGEVRIADYAVPLRRTVWSSIVIGLFKPLGDTPYDYVSIFRGLGYEPDVEVLGLEVG